MAVLVNNAPYKSEPWQRYLQEFLPDMPIWIYPDIPDTNAVKYAAVWDHPHNDLERYPNLRAILNLGAGMDLIDQQPSLPDVPVVRLIDPAVGTDMAQYAMYWTMHFQRHYHLFRDAQQRREWLRVKHTQAREYKVSVVGLGLIGGYIAENLAQNNFSVRGWSRSQKQLGGVKTFSGDAGLSDALAGCDVLVNCLPLNEYTKHFFDRTRLELLPHGAHLINVSRGAVIDDVALQDLLQSGHIAGAALDVFAEEPLAADSPYWSMPNVYVTPHISGITYARAASRVLADNILRMENGEQPFPIYHRES